MEIVDTRFAREFDLKLLCPVPDLIDTTPEDLSRHLYSTIHRLVQEHSNTLVFTNTRNGAERILHNLRVRYPPEWYTEENTGCHHGSMGTEGEALRRGAAQIREGEGGDDLDVARTRGSTCRTSTSSSR
ncbi:hypothetical protein [Methanoculleus chikugoensis]|uniref:hypothetical protein n=1 Tax=Methanoculleus chikugoensis TaxID=118126 RepID=UPI000A5DFC8F|nr:hypothetical protein [Methanoculleus chikugoensis]